MPLFEFFRVAKGKLDLVQEKPASCLTEPSSRTEDGLVELGWENGPVLIQSQCGSGSNSSRATKAQLLSLNNNVEDISDQDNLKTTKVVNPNSLEEFPSSDQNDYAVPWMSNYPMHQSDCNTYFASELPGLDVNYPPLIRSTFGSQEKDGSSEGYPDAAIVTTTTTTSYQLCLPMPFQSQPSFPSLGSQAIDSIAMSTSGMDPMNFPCFSRPVALRRSRSRDMAASDVPNNIVSDWSKSKVKPSEVIFSTFHSEPEKLSAAAKGVEDGSSSEEPLNNLKRKSHDQAESSEGLSGDIEDESVSLKKEAAPRGTKGKRIRSAEVHNLSERKRRDRINEKMRALQDLIPNCNKVDKALMLDKAIEYLKSLQLHLQIMTMGVGGMYMPPMMLPNGMTPPMVHYPNMGIGMGIGIGFRGTGIGIPSMAVLPNLQFYGHQGLPLAMSRPLPPLIPQATVVGLRNNGYRMLPPGNNRDGPTTG